MGGHFRCAKPAAQRDTFAAMKTLAKLSALFCSVLATLSLAAGLNQIAAKLDPVSQKAQNATTFNTGEVTPLPCVSCIIDPE
jgi:hypothetical protein